MAGIHNEVLYGINVDFSGSIHPSAQVSANGQLLIGSSVAPNIRVATLSAGFGISVTNGNGSISIASVGGGLNWQAISGNLTLAINNGYFCISPGGALSLALPAVSSVGDTIAVVLDGSTSWTITQPNAANQIRIAGNQTTLGVGGSISSTSVGDTVYLICQTANARWVVTDFIGNITIV